MLLWDITWYDRTTWNPKESTMVLVYDITNRRTFEDVVSHVGSIMIENINNEDPLLLFIVGHNIELVRDNPYKR